MASKARWAFVYWIQTNDWSVQPVESVIQKEMLFNPKLKGQVEFVGDKKAKPADGWKLYEAHVLASGSKSLFGSTWLG